MGQCYVLPGNCQVKVENAKANKPNTKDKGQCDVFKADEPDISGLTLAGIIVLIEKNIFIPVCI